MRKMLLAVLICFLSVNVDAAIVNGSFENGMTGYTQSGSGGSAAVIGTLGSGMINPTHGEAFLFMSSNHAGFHEFMSIQSQSFSIEAGVTSLSFDFNVLTNQNVSSVWFETIASVGFFGKSLLFCSTADDRFGIMDDDISGINSVAAFEYLEWQYDVFQPLESDVSTPSGEFFDKQTGWHRVSVDISELAGLGLNFNLEFLLSVMVGAELFDTALLIDNIQLETSMVPLPSALFLLGFGLIPIFMIRRNSGLG